MDDVGFKWRHTPAKRQTTDQCGELRTRAFQIDPGWYEAHWLTPPQAKPLGAIRRIAAAAAGGFWAIVDGAASLKRAVGELPSEAGYERARLRIGAFPSWFGGSDPGV